MSAAKSNMRIGATDGGDNVSASVNHIAAPFREDHSNGLPIKKSGSGANRNDQDQVQDDAVPFFQGDDLIKVDQGDRLYQSIKSQFISRLNSQGVSTQVVAIHRNAFSGLMKQAKLQSFFSFARGMARICGGNANVTYAWYGASKDEICKIITRGFGDSISSGIYGRGVYLSPDDYPLDSIESTVADEKGLRHLLLCRVILGRMELIRPGSEQSHPSSEQFDSGVDNLSSPRKHIIWNTHTNTHILPEYIVCFRAPTGFQDCPAIWKVVLSKLSKVLPQHSMELIKKNHNDLLQKKITAHEYVQRLTQIAGEKLLTAIIEQALLSVDCP